VTGPGAIDDGREASDRGLVATVPRRLDRNLPRRERVLRTVSVGMIVLSVGGAATGLLGARSAVAAAEANGYRLEVTHARINRPGLAHELSIEVFSVDGDPLPSETTLHLDAGYLALLDDNGMEPTPVRSFNTEQSTSWVFAVPRGASHLRVDIDARLEPGAQWGADGSATLVIEGKDMVTARFSTWILP
jgi:hypothetical protein